MNRRDFTKSLAAIFAIPALPAIPMAAPAAVSVPTQARFWAIYMTGLHGKCTPRALQTMLNISASEAKGFLNQLVVEGVIKPNHLLDGIKQAKQVRPAQRSKPNLPREREVPAELRNLRAPINCHCMQV